VIQLPPTIPSPIPEDDGDDLEIFAGFMRAYEGAAARHSPG